MKRHLAPPTNPINRFRIVGLSEGFGEIFKNQYVTHYGSWEARKSEAKRTRIDQSLAEDQVEFHRVKFMVKKEVTAVSFQELPGIKKARGIQFAPNERSAYEFVNEFDAFSHALVEESEKEIDVDGIKFQLTYAAQMSHETISQFATESEALRARYACSVIDERDGKNWDANVQKPHRLAIAALYESIGGKSWADYVRTGIAVSGSYRDKSGVKVTYHVDGTVKSGHGDTSCGNGFLNREITIQAVVSLPRHLRPVRVRGLIMGDDYIGWLYFDKAVDWQELVRELNKAEAMLGIHPERGLFRQLEHASFISLGFYRGHDGVTFVALPKLGRLFSRLFWTVTDLRGRDARRLASGVAQSFYPLFSTCPAMRDFLKYHMQEPPLGVSDCNHYYEWDKIGLKRLPVPINWDENTVLKYGFPISEVTIPIQGAQGCGLLDNYLVREMLREDQSDPAQRRGVLASA